MDDEELAHRYQSAIKALQPYIKFRDGGFLLEVESGESLGIDPITFADLTRSLAHTNDLIKRGEIDPKELGME